MRNYDYVVFCPYFGNLPNNFELWLKSCSYNDKFKFIVFTNDSRKTELPENVELIILSFEEFKGKVQKKFDFKISLDAPYKLCDYKIAYGYIFSEYLGSCKYWGACDMDLIFGDLLKFMPNEEYDKISTRGHFMLMKNTKGLREAFMISNTSKIGYKDILSNNMHFASDEIGDYNINNILLKNGYSIYNYENTVADISPIRINMRISPMENDYLKGNRIFSFENGKVFCNEIINKKIIKKEYSYIHFQKRKMNFNITNSNYNKFIITYKSFENHQEVTNKYILKNQPKIIIGKTIIVMRIKSAIKKLKRRKKIKEIEKGGIKK